MDAITHVPVPYNEPIGTFAPGTPERASLEQGLNDLVATTHELPNVIGGKKVMASGDKIEVRSPHEHSRVLGVTANSTQADATSAIGAQGGSDVDGGAVPPPPPSLR